MTTPKPTVFVGSSSEGLEYARAVRRGLKEVADVSMWDEDFARPGRTFLEILTARADKFDFAVLVFTPDVLVEARGVRGFGPRDNLLFELGLFMASIGRERTFIVRPEGDVVILPSDLDGLITVPFDAQRPDGSSARAVGDACDLLRQEIGLLGHADPYGRQLRALESRQTTQEVALARQETEIQSLRVALRGIVTQHEFAKIVGLMNDGPFMCRWRPRLIDELRRIRNLGLIGSHPNVGLTAIRDRYSEGDMEFDLKQFCFVTDDGREYVRLRVELDPTRAPDDG